MNTRRIKLHGFNNLTKALSFNIYDMCYARTDGQRKDYIAYIDEAYNAERLTQILTDVSNIIGANILNIARQDYDPQGASVTILISEEPVVHDDDTSSAAPGPLPETVLGHLDKSHITVHTYPESHPHDGDLHLPGRYRCSDLRHHFTAQGTELSDPFVRVGYRDG